VLGVRRSASLAGPHCTRDFVFRLGLAAIRAAVDKSPFGVGISIVNTAVRGDLFVLGDLVFCGRHNVFSFPYTILYREC
jgi:hypothetical protein